jgi:hypothetical protein
MSIKTSQTRHKRQSDRWGVGRFLVTGPIGVVLNG